MYLCQICGEPRRDVFRAYRYECAECRSARKALKKGGVSLREIKAYLIATGYADSFSIEGESLTVPQAQPNRKSSVVPLPETQAVVFSVSYVGSRRSEIIFQGPKSARNRH